MKKALSASNKGVTLAELMVAVAVLGVALVGLTKAFDGITRSILTTKARTLATNIAQEQMALLKQRNYYRILITTHPVTWPGTNVLCDHSNGYFPPETLTAGGLSFTRLTLVQVAQENPSTLVISTFSPTTPDGGMKLVTINVGWEQFGTQRFLELKNIVANPDVAMTTSFFEGSVHDAASADIQGAVVSIVEKPVWHDITGANGQYKVGGLPGNYNLRAKARGYFPATEPLELNAFPSNITPYDFTLIEMASGVVRGSVWLNDKLRISRVLASLDDSGFDQEFVEIFNPTTYTWTVDGDVGLQFERRDDSNTPMPLNPIDITYISTGIVPGGYYLFANTTTIVLSGSSVTADAVWDPAGVNNIDAAKHPYFSTDQNIIPHYEISSVGDDEGGGALQLESASQGVLDQVGWCGGGSPKCPDTVETAHIFGQTQGINEEEVFKRICSTAGYDASIGPAYDSNDNRKDWVFVGNIANLPYNTASSTVPVIAGEPAIGGYVSSNDGLSSAVQAIAQGNPPYAYFELIDIATGIWNFYFTHDKYMTEGSTPIYAGSDIYAGNVMLENLTTKGMVSGQVTDVSGVPLSGIMVTGSGDIDTSDTNGLYMVQATTGPASVIVANPGNDNAAYVSENQAVNVALGQMTSNVNFSLCQGGQLKAWVTMDGLNPLPGVAVVAKDTNGQPFGQAVSESDGYVRLVDLSTGTFTLEPVLDAGEASSPPSQAGTVSQGAVVFVTTFTISNAFGTLEGEVTAGGELLKTGALVVVTTTTIMGSDYPPDLNLGILTQNAYYFTSSNDLGYYSVQVRGNATPYNVYGYYPSIDPNGVVTMNKKGLMAPVTIISGQTVVRDIDF